MEIEMRPENCIEDSQYMRDDTDCINEYNKNSLDILKVDLVNIYFDSEQNMCFVLKWESESDCGYLIFSKTPFGILNVSSNITNLNKSFIQRVFDTFIEELNII